MESEHRRALEATAYGRGSTDEERAEAVRAIKDAERAAALRVQPTDPSAGDEHSDDLDSPTALARRLWRTPARPIVLWVAGVVAAAAVMIGVVTVVLAPQPGAEASTPRSHDRPELTQLVAVGDDWLANPPSERERQRIELAVQPAAVAAATALGEREGNIAVGVLGADGRVCLLLMLAPEASSAGGTSSQFFCATSAEFSRDGMVADRGAWDIHWYSDGTVTWTGI